MDMSKISLALGLLLSIANIANWIYKYFNGAYKIKKKNEDLQEEIVKNSNDIIKLKNYNDDVIHKLENLFEISKMQIRHAIVTTCLVAIDNGYIQQYQLQSLEDMYTVYRDILHSNSYVSTLMEKVRLLQIRNGE